MEEAPELGEVYLAGPVDVEVSEQRLDFVFAQPKSLPIINTVVTEVSVLFFNHCETCYGRGMIAFMLFFRGFSLETLYSFTPNSDLEKQAAITPMKKPQGLQIGVINREYHCITQNGMYSGDIG